MWKEIIVFAAIHVAVILLLFKSFANNMSLVLEFTCVMLSVALAVVAIYGIFLKLDILKENSNWAILAGFADWVVMLFVTWAIRSWYDNSSFRWRKYRVKVKKGTKVE